MDLGSHHFPGLLQRQLPTLSNWRDFLWPWPTILSSACHRQQDAHGCHGDPSPLPSCLCYLLAVVLSTFPSNATSSSFSCPLWSSLFFLLSQSCHQLPRWSCRNSGGEGIRSVGGEADKVPQLTAWHLIRDLRVTFIKYHWLSLAAVNSTGHYKGNHCGPILHFKYC